MSKILFIAFIVIMILSVGVNLLAFILEKVYKKKMNNMANKQ